MSRLRVLAIVAVLILFGEVAWILWPRGEEPAGPSVGESIRRMHAPPPKRRQSPVEEHPASDLFTFEHDGKTVTVDLSEARRSLNRMIRRDLATVDVNHGDGVPEPGTGFLSWPSRQSVGTEIIKTQKCRVIDFTNPSSRSGGDPYYLVRIFIRQENGALMRMQGYNWDGRLEMAYMIDSWKRGHDGTIREKKATTRYYRPGTKKVKGELEYLARP